MKKKKMVRHEWMRFAQQNLTTKVKRLQKMGNLFTKKQKNIFIVCQHTHYDGVMDIQDHPCKSSFLLRYI